MADESRSSFVSLLIPAIKAAIWFIVVCGIIYSIVTTAVTHIIFLHQTQSSPTKFNDKVITSKVMAQNLKTPNYFHPDQVAINRTITTDKTSS